MHIKEKSRKHTLKLAIALVLASGLTGQAFAGDVSCPVGLCFPGGDDIVDGTVNAADLGVDSVGSSEIATGAVGSDEIATGAVDSAEIATGAVTTTEIEDGTIQTVDIANSAITTAKINDSAVTSDKIADNSVGSSEMLDNAIGNAEMQDNAIGNAEMQDNAIGNAEMLDNAIGNAEMLDNAIGNAEMLDDAIGSAEIIDGSITGDDLGLLDELQVDAGDPFLSVDAANIQFGSDDGSDSAITTMTDINANTRVTDGGSSDFTELNMTATSASLTVSDDSGGPHVNGITIDQTATTLVGGTGTTTVVIGDDLDIDVSGFADIDVVGAITATGGTVLIDDAASSLNLDGTDATLTSTGTASMVSGSTVVSVDGTTASMTDGSAIVSTSGDVATMSSSTGGSVVVNAAGDATMSSAEGATASTVDDAASLTSANGLAVITAEDTEASLLFEDATGDIHGITVDATDTFIDGGTGTSSLRLNDAGATIMTSLPGSDVDIDAVDDVLVDAGDDVDITAVNNASMNSSSGATVDAFSGGTARLTSSANSQVEADSSGNASLFSDNSSSVRALTDGTAIMASSGGADVEVTGTTANMRSGNGLGRVDVTDTSASVTVNNGAATHGLEIDVVPGNTTLSGGTGSTTLTLNDSGAHLDNRLDMGFNQINNMADGVLDFDAVNKRQLDEVEDLAKSGIAAVAAMAAIPGPIPGKRYSVGIGAGYFKSESALALGINAQVTDQIMLTAAAGTSSSETAGAVGASFSW